MITYSPLWKTLESKGVTQYALIHKYHVSPAQLTRLKKGQYVSLHTVEMFCQILDCSISDIVLYVPNKK